MDAQCDKKDRFRPNCVDNTCDSPRSIDELGEFIALTANLCKWGSTSRGSICVSSFLPVILLRLADHYLDLLCICCTTCCGHVELSYDQLWAASLIGRNAVTLRWGLSYVHCFTVTRCDLITSHMWHYNVTRCDVTWCSLNVNVRYILRCVCLRFVFCFVFFLTFYCKFILNTI